MNQRFSQRAIENLQAEFSALLTRLPQQPNGELIYETLMTLLRMTEEEIDRLDWKILKAALQDMESGFQVFQSHRHVRKIAVFGSSRLPAESEEYQLAVQFAHCVTERGFRVMTGAGGGIMEAANKGAGPGQSFGLNIQLPFEQSTNPFIEGDPKLINFKYFFTRKLFFLREADAIALFPGGFGTQDEAFECLTLSQTGKSPPVPVVLVDKPGGTYWREWDRYVQSHLTQNDLISAQDHRLYTLTDDLGVACQTISDFYRVYHSSRYVGDRLVIRLNHELTDDQVAALNQEFQDILIDGRIHKCQMLPEENQHQQPQPQQVSDQTEQLPRLVFRFNQRDHGRLYQMINTLNEMGSSAELDRPQRK